MCIVQGPELLSKYIGASEQAVRDTFLRSVISLKEDYQIAGVVFTKVLKLKSKF